MPLVFNPNQHMDWRRRTHESDDELKAAFDALNGERSWEITRSFDRMDDREVIGLGIKADYNENTDLNRPIELRFQARRDSFSTQVDSLFSFEDNYFYRRGSGSRVRIRYDNDPAIYIDPKFSNNHGAVFLSGYAELPKLLGSTTLKLEIVPQFGKTVFASFDLSKAQLGMTLFARALLGKRFAEISTLNAAIVDLILRSGLKNVLTKKAALKEQGYYHDVINADKSYDFYKAAHDFALARKCSEFFGYSDRVGDKIVTYDPWLALLYREASPYLREIMGPLKINE